MTWLRQQYLLKNNKCSNEFLVVSTHNAATFKPDAAASTFSLKLNLTFDEEASLNTTPATKASPAPKTEYVLVPFTLSAFTCAYLVLPLSPQLDDTIEPSSPSVKKTTFTPCECKICKSPANTFKASCAEANFKCGLNGQGDGGEPGANDLLKAFAISRSSFAFGDVASTTFTIDAIFTDLVTLVGSKNTYSFCSSLPLTMFLRDSSDRFASHTTKRLWPSPIRDDDRTLPIGISTSSTSATHANSSLSPSWSSNRATTVDVLELESIFTSFTSTRNSRCNCSTIFLPTSSSPI